MAMFDPMASFPLLLRALNSYAKPEYKTSMPMTYEDELQYCIDANHDPLLSPMMTPKQTLSRFPRTLMISTDLDPCLDESIMMANRMTDAGVEVHLDIIEALPHGFLSMNYLSKDCQKITEDTLATMHRFMEQT